MILFCTFFTISHFSALTFLCFQEFKKIFELYKHVDHHCENPVLGDFFVSSPKFFSARVGGGYSHFWGPKAPKSGVRAPKARGLRKFLRKILPAPKAPVKSWRFFHLENEVYLVKIAFASENLEKFSPPAGYFFVQHL